MLKVLVEGLGVNGVKVERLVSVENEVLIFLVEILYVFSGVGDVA